MGRPNTSDAARPYATTTGRAAYPAPRRLQRKRADSQLAATNSNARPPPASRSSSAAITQRFAGTRPSMMSGWSGYSGRQGAVSPVVEEHHPRSAQSSRVGPMSRGSSNNAWRMQQRGPPPSQQGYGPPPSRPARPYVHGPPMQRGHFAQPPSQMSEELLEEPPMVVEDAPRLPPSLQRENSESRPTTSGSSKSGRNSLYKWLNDSYTSWAK